MSTEERSFDPIGQRFVSDDHDAAARVSHSPQQVMPPPLPAGSRGVPLATDDLLPHTRHHLADVDRGALRPALGLNQRRVPGGEGAHADAGSDVPHVVEHRLDLVLRSKKGEGGSGRRQSLERMDRSVRWRHVTAGQTCKCVDGLRRRAYAVHMGLSFRAFSPRGSPRGCSRD